MVVYSPNVEDIEAAQQRDYHTIVISDCVTGTEPTLHKAFLQNIEYVLGDVTDSAEILKLLT